ncbi:hypothetical protein HAX54_048926 [Datura stramonium]|uniref:Uncharacterized protein n=1 Tax=Datura stramonium TaxID=4076 RepID=A0ABS8WNP8_DATST|nr:hypothetical protein [Datura stramonium]
MGLDLPLDLQKFHSKYRIVDLDDTIPTHQESPKNTIQNFGNLQNCEVINSASSLENTARFEESNSQPNSVDFQQNPSIGDDRSPFDLSSHKNLTFSNLPIERYGQATPSNFFGESVENRTTNRSDSSENQGGAPPKVCSSHQDRPTLKVSGQMDGATDGGEHLKFPGDNVQGTVRAPIDQNSVNTLKAPIGLDSIGMNYTSRIRRSLPDDDIMVGGNQITNWKRDEERRKAKEREETAKKSKGVVATDQIHPSQADTSGMVSNLPLHIETYFQVSRGIKEKVPINPKGNNPQNPKEKGPQNPNEVAPKNPKQQLQNQKKKKNGKTDKLASQK